MAMKFAAALTRTTAKLWIKRIGRSRANFGTGRNWMNPASRWLRMGGGDYSRRSGNHNPQITQITQNKRKRVSHKKAQETQEVILDSLLCLLCLFVASF